jgi:hypothetical protein
LAFSFVGFGIALAVDALLPRGLSVSLVRDAFSFVGFGFSLVRDALSFVGFGFSLVRDALAFVRFVFPLVRDAFSFVGFRTVQAVELLKRVVGAVPCSHGALPRREHTFVNGLGALLTGLSALQFCCRTPDGGIPAKQARLHPDACLFVNLGEIPPRDAGVIHGEIIARSRRPHNVPLALTRTTFRCSMGCQESAGVLVTTLPSDLGPSNLVADHGNRTLDQSPWQGASSGWSTLTQYGPGYQPSREFRESNLWHTEVPAYLWLLDGRGRWTSAPPLGRGGGLVDRVVEGVHVDVTEG